MIETFAILLLLSFLALIWMSICNYRTYNQRQTIIWGVNRHLDWHSVSYDKHLWYLFTLRNAYKLYKVQV